MKRILTFVTLLGLFASPALALGPVNGGGSGGALPTPISTPATNAAGVAVYCTSSNSTSCTTSLNVYTAKPWTYDFYSAGTPSANAIIGMYACTHEIDLPKNFTGGGPGTFPLNVSASTFAGTSPGTADTYTVEGTGTSGTTMAPLGTIVLPTSNSTAPTLTGANACASGTCTACVAGGAIEIVAPGTLHSEANFSISLTGQEQMQ